MIISQSNEIAFQLITNMASVQAQSPLTNFVDEVWYLLAYPDAPHQAADSVPNNVAAATGGSTQFVNIFAAQRGGGNLVGQQGVWVLARIPTVVGSLGPLLDINLINDGFVRLIYDVTSNVNILSRFNTTQQLQIIANGVLIFNINPIPGALTPLVPIQNDTNAYTPTGVHFNGATGLVTAQPIVTKNTGLISFAGWFNIDTSMTGQLEFSQGSGNNQLFYDRSIPTPGAWCHMMGTIDAVANLAVIVVNGNVGIGTVAGAGNAFTSAPTNGTNLYIGTDNQGHFYKGDIADLSIWFDFSFLQNGVITNEMLGTVVRVAQNLGGVTTVQPVNPANFIFGFNTLRQPFQTGVDNVLTVAQPQVFLSGPASQALTPQTQNGTLIQTIQSLKVVSGALTNSSTNPSKITIGPPI